VEQESPETWDQKKREKNARRHRQEAGVCGVPLFRREKLQTSVKQHQQEKRETSRTPESHTTLPGVQSQTKQEARKPSWATKGRPSPELQGTGKRKGRRTRRGASPGKGPQGRTHTHTRGEIAGTRSGDRRPTHEKIRRHALECTKIHDKTRETKDISWPRDRRPGGSRALFTTKWVIKKGSAGASQTVRRVTIFKRRRRQRNRLCPNEYKERVSTIIWQPLINGTSDTRTPVH